MIEQIVAWIVFQFVPSMKPDHGSQRSFFPPSFSAPGIRSGLMENTCDRWCEASLSRSAAPWCPVSWTAEAETWWNALAPVGHWGTSTEWEHPFLVAQFSLSLLFNLWTQVIGNKVYYSIDRRVQTHHGLTWMQIESFGSISLFVHSSWPCNRNRGSTKFAKVIMEASHWQSNWSTTPCGMGAMWVSGRATPLASLDGYIWPLGALFIVHCSSDTLLSCRYLNNSASLC